MLRAVPPPLLPLPPPPSPSLPLGRRKCASSAACSTLPPSNISESCGTSGVSKQQTKAPPAKLFAPVAVAATAVGGWCAAVPTAATHQPGHCHCGESTQLVSTLDGRSRPEENGRHWAYCFFGLRKHALRSLEQQWEVKQLPKLAAQATISGDGARRARQFFSP